MVDLSQVSLQVCLKGCLGQVWQEGRGSGRVSKGLPR